MIMKNVAAENLEIRSKQWPQYLAVLAGSIFSFASGLHYSWPSSAFTNDDFPKHITIDEQSYIAMIQPFGAILGCLVTSFVVDRIGRKISLLLMSPPLLITWIIIYFTENAIILCLARFICGIGDGILFLAMPMYIGEVVEPKIRGKLGCSISIFMLLGMIVINVVGSILTIKNTALVCSVSPVIAFVFFLWMPESPTYLVMKDRMEDAKKSMYFLQRCDVGDRLEILKKDVGRQISERGNWKDLFMIRTNRRALLTMIGARSMQQGCGAAVFGILTQVIFRDANASNPMFLANLYVTTQLVMTTSGSFLIDKFGRKPILLLSTLSCGVVLCTGGVYFYLIPDSAVYQWIPIAVMFTYVSFFRIGLGTVPTLFLGELFSASIKSKALCFMCIYYSAMISITVQIYYLMYSVGMYGSFLLFGGFCFLSTVWGYFYIPETKGKSLEDIQNYFRGGKDQIA